MTSKIRSASVSRILPAHNVVNDAYRVLSIERTVAPGGADETDWFKYQIGVGKDVVTGYRRGTLLVVQRDVEDVVDGLNDRRMVGRNR